jgi:hypothetical protein
LLQEKQSN